MKKSLTVCWRHGGRKAQRPKETLVPCVSRLGSLIDRENNGYAGAQHASFDNHIKELSWTLMVKSKAVLNIRIPHPMC